MSSQQRFDDLANQSNEKEVELMTWQPGPIPHMDADLNSTYQH